MEWRAPESEESKAGGVSMPLLRRAASTISRLPGAQLIEFYACAFLEIAMGFTAVEALAEIAVQPPATLVAIALIVFSSTVQATDTMAWSLSSLREKLPLLDRFLGPWLDAGAAWAARSYGNYREAVGIKSLSDQIGAAVEELVEYVRHSRVCAGVSTNHRRVLESSE